MARASSLVRAHGRDATIFFNSRLRPDRDPEAGSRPELPYYTHVEIESLPGGEWGYHHYPLFATYFQTLGLPLLGMTGVFHTAWGDFGTVKTEAALGYECARMLASGAACSVGDHLHPRGVLDEATYDRLGTAYARVEALEPWCREAEPVPEVGVLLAETGPRFHVVGRDVDEGAARMLLELHRPFQFLDAAADLSPYQVIVAPDDRPFDAELAARVSQYLNGGGALLLTHRAGLTPDGEGFAPAIAEAVGLVYVGDAADSPDFLVAEQALGEPFTGYHQALYERGSRVSLAGAVPLAMVGHPYFSRTPDLFFGHRQAAFDRTGNDPAIAQRGRVIYCHSPLFRAYRHHAVPAYRDLVGRLLDRLVPDRVVAAPDLPTTAEVGLLQQSAEGNRHVVHLVHAVPQRRGADIDIVEDILPLRDVRLGVRLPAPATSVTLAPGGEVLPFQVVDRVTWATVPRVDGHQVVVFA